MRLEISPNTSFNHLDQMERWRDFLDRNHRLNATIRLIDTDWPCAVDFREKILSVVTDSIHAPTRPVIYEAFEVGANDYRRELASSGDVARLKAFVSGVERALLLNLIGTRVRMSGNRVWSFHQGKSLGSLLRSTSTEDIRRLAIDEVEPGSEEKAESSRFYWSIVSSTVPVKRLMQDG